MDSFKDAPQSLPYVRAVKANNAAMAAPRDALVDLLRDIDSGAVDVDMCVIAYRGRDKGGTFSSYLTAGGKGIQESLGLLTRVAHLINLSSD